MYSESIGWFRTEHTYIRYHIWQSLSRVAVSDFLALRSISESKLLRASPSLSPLVCALHTCYNMITHYIPSTSTNKTQGWVSFVLKYRCWIFSSKGLVLVPPTWNVMMWTCSLIVALGCGVAPVADQGFWKGGFVYYSVHEEPKKKIGWPHPLLVNYAH